MWLKERLMLTVKIKLRLEKKTRKIQNNPEREKLELNKTTYTFTYILGYKKNKGGHL